MSCGATFFDNSAVTVAIRLLRNDLRDRQHGHLREADFPDPHIAEITLRHDDLFLSLMETPAIDEVGCLGCVECRHGEPVQLAALNLDPCPRREGTGLLSCKVRLTPVGWVAANA